MSRVNMQDEAPYEPPQASTAETNLSKEGLAALYGQLSAIEDMLESNRRTVEIANHQIADAINGMSRLEQQRDKLKADIVVGEKYKHQPSAHEGKVLGGVPPYAPFDRPLPKR